MSTLAQASTDGLIIYLLTNRTLSTSPLQQKTIQHKPEAGEQVEVLPTHSLHHPIVAGPAAAGMPAAVAGQVGEQQGGTRRRGEGHQRGWRVRQIGSPWAQQGLCVYVCVCECVYVCVHVQACFTARAGSCVTCNPIP